MRRFLIFTLLALCLIGCGEEGIETNPDIPTVNVVFPETACPNPDNNWELIATLERNPLNPSHFYVPDGKAEHLPDLTDTINGAYAEGKYFIFAIKKDSFIHHIQFYLLQPTPPVFDKANTPAEHLHFEIFRWQFPSEPIWYRSTHFGLAKQQQTQLMRV